MGTTKSSKKGTKKSRKKGTKNSRRKMSPVPELLSAAMDAHLSASPECQSPWAKHKGIAFTKIGNNYHCGLCGAPVLIQRGEPSQPRTPAQLRRLIETALRTPDSQPRSSEAFASGVYHERREIDNSKQALCRSQENDQMGQVNDVEVLRVRGRPAVRVPSYRSSTALYRWGLVNNIMRTIGPPWHPGFFSLDAVAAMAVGVDA